MEAGCHSLGFIFQLPSRRLHVCRLQQQSQRSQCGARMNVWPSQNHGKGFCLGAARAKAVPGYQRPGSGAMDVPTSFTRCPGGLGAIHQQWNGRGAVAKTL